MKKVYLISLVNGSQVWIKANGMAPSLSAVRRQIERGDWFEGGDERPVNAHALRSGDWGVPITFNWAHVLSVAEFPVLS